MLQLLCLALTMACTNTTHFTTHHWHTARACVRGLVNPAVLACVTCGCHTHTHWSHGNCSGASLFLSGRQMDVMCDVKTPRVIPCHACMLMLCVWSAVVMVWRHAACPWSMLLQCSCGTSIVSTQQPQSHPTGNEQSTILRLALPCTNQMTAGHGDRGRPLRSQPRSDL